MTRTAATDLSTQPQKPEFAGILFLAATGIVTTGWVAALVWAAITFMNWLVA